jgi:hypothetical protein
MLHLKLSSIQLELSDLQSRYDDLLRVKERAEARYRADYKKWKDFKVWLFDSNKKFKESRKGITGEDKRVLDVGQATENARKLEETGLPRAGGSNDTTGVIGAYIDLIKTNGAQCLSYGQ